MKKSIENPQNLQKLIDIGIALSKEKNIDVLLEKILIEARKISDSDGGTLYLMDDSFTKLYFKIMHTESKNFYRGGSGDSVPDDVYPVPLYKNGEPNLHNACVVSALRGETINIKDAYSDENYDFSGTKGVDKRLGYHSKSFLNVPLKDHKNKVIGVLQLINAQYNKKIISFSDDIVHLVESLASQASIALTNQLLIKEQKDLFKSFIKLVSEALDKKDKVTGGHCTRVPNLTMLIADAINLDQQGKFKDFKFSTDELEELYVAGWLHDFGKVSTPDHVMNKSTKLQGIFDKIDFIKLKFEILKRDLKISYYEKKITNKASEINENDLILKQELEKLNSDILFLEKCNIGGEYLSDDVKDKLLNISQRQISINDKKYSLLLEDDMENLSISKGTLNDEDRKIMNKHVELTYELLNKLPYPNHLKKVPFYAGCHHEKINGTGYPNGYSGDKLPLQARIIAIADVFEGLTAPDRPYKEPYKLSKAMNILKFMVDDGEIDKDLFNLFINQKVYLKYAKENINSKQIDIISEKELLS